LNSSNDEKKIKEVLEFNNLKKEDILVLNKRYLDYISDIKPVYSIFINLHNNLFIKENLIINDYLKIQLNDFFNCKSYAFDSPSIDKLNDLILDPINHVNETDKLVLINNFSFKAKFLHETYSGEIKFKEENIDPNIDKKYISIESVVTRATLGAAYFPDLKFSACQIQYNKGFLMTILLPYPNVSIEEIENKLDSSLFEQILNQTKSNRMYTSLELPTFKIESEYDVII
jgi:hypothetical protein